MNEPLINQLIGRRPRGSPPCSPRPTQSASRALSHWTLTRPMGKKLGRGQGSFISDTRQHHIEFYRQVVQVTEEAEQTKGESEKP